MHGIFEEISFILIAATLLAVAVRSFKFPPLVGYILTGLIIGPLGFKILHYNELLEALREVGVALLLFFVGLEIDWQKTRHILKTVWQLGAIQIVSSVLFSWVVALFLGFNLTAATYLGLALASSSTIIIVKLLSESRELNSLHGHLSTGILLFQDLITIVALILLAGIGVPSLLPWPIVLLILLAKSLSFLVVLWFLSKHVLPLIFAYVAHSAELLFTASLAWCFLLAITLQLIDLPLEIGAFLAGLSLATLPYSYDIASRLRSVRDFFVIIMFVTIGSSFVMPSLEAAVIGLIFLAVTMIGKPLITMITLELHGYKSRTAFFTAITQNQLSEFSLIILALATSHSLIPDEIANVVTGVAITSILFSTILMSYRKPLYKWIRPILQQLERKSSHLIPAMPVQPEFSDHVIIFGYHRMGCHIFRKVSRAKDMDVVIVDMNPDIVRSLLASNKNCIYGDVQDDEVLAQASIAKARVVISTIPHREDTEFLLKYARGRNHNAILIVTAHYVEDAIAYYELGADYVILPHLLGGEHVGELLHEDAEKLRRSLHKLAMPVIRLHPTSNEVYFD